MTLYGLMTATAVSQTASASLPACFKAYDVRGRVPDELNEPLAWRIGQVFAELFGARTVAIGRDVRDSSAALSKALAGGLRSGGADVHDIGLCGTEEIYFATTHLGLDGGIMVTASHNPADYNGMKFVRAGARPVGMGTGLQEIASRVAGNPARNTYGKGRYRRIDVRSAYVEHVLSFVDHKTLRPTKLVVNAGNGSAGPVVDAIAAQLPVELVRVAHEPDGSFPNGVPNPLLPEMRAQTVDAVVRSGADFGIAWDGDFDRCFLFDEQGRFVDGYYLVGLFAKAFLGKWPGATVVHDPRLVWNTVELVEKAGGLPVVSRCGHTYMKDAMRAANAIYGGEMSGHHYFRNFGYCDSGMIPWLLVLEMISRTGQPLSSLIAPRIQRYPISGEINRPVLDTELAVQRVRERFRDGCTKMSFLDGLTIEHPDWRFNLRPSNTEPLLRLNVEAREDEVLLRRKTDELLEVLQ